MARLIPDTAFNSPDMTPGERRATRALYQNLEDSAIVWYQPKLAESRRPDLIVYLPSVGLILYEVKDWSLSSISNANPDYWEIQSGGETRAEKNPFQRVRSYYYNLKDNLAREPLLLHSQSHLKGKVKFPIATAVIFPNITRRAYVASKYDQVIEEKYILFKDDLEAIGQTLSGKALIDKLRFHFDPWWYNEELNDDEVNKLRAILYPEITSKQKDKGGQEKDIILDEYQEQVAKKMGSGHRIVRGVAGSGKSLVLCAKARLLLSQHPKWKILFTCYNISLASQLRYYLKSFAGMNEQENKTILEHIDKRIDVVHFHGLCSRLFKKTKTSWPRINANQVLHTAGFATLSDSEKEAKLDEMESSLLGQELQKTASTHTMDHYDAILVDESQDFHPSWLKGLLLLLNGQSNFLLLAEDPNQKIYPRTFSYKDAGIDVVGGGRVFNLPIGYRSTKEIILPASRLVIKSNWDDFYRKYIEEEKDQTVNELHRLRGYYPIITVKKHYEDVCEYIVEDIKQKLGNGHQHSDIGIIYLTRNRKNAIPESQLQLFSDDQDIDYIGTLRARMASFGIPNYWLTQNKETKQCYDQFKDQITISTLFSAKGLEFEVVYLVGLELYPWVKRNPRENASMIYVGMTRAKTELHMLTTERTNLVSEIESIIDEIKAEN